MTGTMPPRGLRLTPVPSARPAPLPLAEARRRAAVECRPARYVQGALAAIDVEDDPYRDPVPPRTPRADLPDPREWAARIGQALVETMAGLRPPTQLVRWVLPDAYAGIARASLTAQRRLSTAKGSHRRRILIRRVDVCEPADGVAEVSLVVQDGHRVRALALRLVGRDGRWRVEALQLA